MNYENQIIQSNSIKFEVYFNFSNYLLFNYVISYKYYFIFPDFYITRTIYLYFFFCELYLSLSCIKIYFVKTYDSRINLSFHLLNTGNSVMYHWTNFLKPSTWSTLNHCLGIYGLSIPRPWGFYFPFIFKAQPKFKGTIFKVKSIFKFIAT